MIGDLCKDWTKVGSILDDLFTECMMLSKSLGIFPETGDE